MPSRRRAYRVLSEQAGWVIDELAEEPALLVGGAVALAYPRIANKLKAEARRFGEGKGYAPHEHLGSVINGYVTGLKSKGVETPGKKEHGLLHVDPELVYELGATLLVLGIRYHCHQLSSDGHSLPREVMAEIEEAFDLWLIANEAGKYAGAAWMMHEITVDTLLGTLNPTPATAELFWEGVFKPLGLNKGPGWVTAAFNLLTPENVAAAFDTRPKLT